MSDASFFRRNFLAVALLHALGLGSLWFFSRAHKPPKAPEVLWLDGGASGSAGASGAPGASGSPSPSQADVLPDIPPPAPVVSKIEPPPVHEVPAPKTPPAPKLSPPKEAEPVAEPPLKEEPPSAISLQVSKPKPEPKPEIKPAPKPEPKPEVKPAPKPEPKPEVKPAPKPEPKPEVKPAPKPEPKPEVKPAPKPEPKPEVKPAPKPEAKPEVKPVPKPEPKSEVKAAPKPEAKAEPKPPKVLLSGGNGDATAPPAVQVVRVELVRPGGGGAAGGMNSTGPGRGVAGGLGGGSGSGNGPGGSGNGPGGSGTGSGTGRGGSGPSASDLGRYNSMIHERFYGVWEQPISVVRSAQDFVAVLKIRIRKDGTIVGREIVSPSGNPAMDESVQRAAEKVQRIDALPAGMTTDPYEVRIAFKLDQG